MQDIPKTVSINRELPLWWLISTIGGGVVTIVGVIAFAINFYTSDQSLIKTVAELDVSVKALSHIITDIKTQKVINEMRFDALSQHDKLIDTTLENHEKKLEKLASRKWNKEEEF